jgi:hypothetical protein
MREPVRGLSALAAIVGGRETLTNRFPEIQ